MSEHKYTLLIVDGELIDLCEASTQSIRYTGLEKDEAMRLAVLSIERGLTVAAWIEDGGAGV